MMDRERVGQWLIMVMAVLCLGMPVGVALGQSSDVSAAASVSDDRLPAAVQEEVVRLRAQVKQLQDQLMPEARAMARARENAKQIISAHKAESPAPAEPSLLREKRRAFIRWIQSQVPRWSRKELLGIAYWQWIGLFFAIIAGVVLDRLVRFVLKITSERIIHRHIDEYNDQIQKMIKPFGLGASALLWVAMLPLLGLGDLPLVILQGAAGLFATLSWTWAGWRLSDLICDVLADRAHLTHTKFDDVLVPMLRKSLKIFIVVIGVIYAAGALNLQVGPLIASVGIGSLGFAFAAKDTIENFFGSVAVLVDRPFEVGDWIVVDKYEGIVEELGFRSTRIRTFYNSQITLPNATLVRATVDNLGRRQYRRIKCTVGVQYDTPADKLVAFREGVQEIVKNHPYTRKDYYQVWLNEFGASSLNFLIYVFVQVPDWTVELRERERLFLDMIRLADRLGISFAFPTQTLHLFNHDNDPPHTPSAPPTVDADVSAELTGILAAQAVMANQPWLKQKPEAHQYIEAPTDVQAFEAKLEALRKKNQGERSGGDAGSL